MIDQTIETDRKKALRKKREKSQRTKNEGVGTDQKEERNDFDTPNAIIACWTLSSFSFAIPNSFRSDGDVDKTRERKRIESNKKQWLWANDFVSGFVAI